MCSVMTWKEARRKQRRVTRHYVIVMALRFHPCGCAMDFILGDSCCCFSLFFDLFGCLAN